MRSKNNGYSFIKFLFSFLLISLTLIKFSLSLSIENIESICSNSDAEINNYFSGDEELPEKYNELDQAEIEKGNDEKIIKLILLTENAEIEYKNAINSDIKIYQIILLILIIIFSFIIIIFETHFFCRFCFGKIKEKENKATYSTFIKIHPFGFLKYFFIDQKERDKYFTEYKLEKALYNKRQLIILSIIILILTIVSIFL